MFQFTPRTKRPQLPALLNTTTLVHDHTYASYRHTLAWLKRYPAGHRLTYPCCAAGCADRAVHHDTRCTAELRATVDAWPVDTPFGTVHPTAEWTQSIERWMGTYLEHVHFHRHTLVGKTLIREFLDTFADMELSPDHLKAMASVEFEIPQDEIRLPLGTHVPWLPMGLIDGVVPFAVPNVAAYTETRIRREPTPHLVPPPNFSWTASDQSWTASCVMEDGLVTQLPYFGVPRDFPLLTDVGTHASPKYTGPQVRRYLKWSVSTDVKTYTDPGEYVDAWISHMYMLIKNERYDKAELAKNRNVFLRTIWVNKKFTNEYGDQKREYMDEYVDQKRRRVARTFGSKYVEPLLSLPIQLLGPDFEAEDDDDEEEEGRMKGIGDSDEDEEEPQIKRAKNKWGSDSDVLLARIQKFKM